MLNLLVVNSKNTTITDINVKLLFTEAKLKRFC